MIALFEPGGVIEYVPFVLSGPVKEIGPGSWGFLINAFPDLRNEVHSIRQSADNRFAFVDGNLITGQNPPPSEPAALALLEVMT